MINLGIYSARQYDKSMNYSILNPIADAELGENAEIDFSVDPRKIIKAHIYLFRFPESDIFKAYPLFVISSKFRYILEQGGITGAIYIPCEISKTPDYDEASQRIDLPDLFCLEPSGTDGLDDIIFHSEIEIKVSNRFLSKLQEVSSMFCDIYEASKE